VTSNRSAIARVLLAFGLAAVWLLAFVEGTGPLDRALLSALYAGHRPAIAEAARVLTLFGSGYVVTTIVVVAAAALAARNHPRVALILLAGNFIGRMLVEVQKYEFGRIRPDLNPHLVTVYTMSFPSAHSSNAMLTYVAMALLLVRDERRRVYWAASALVLTFLIGLSRVMLGVHWPSDVLAGWSFGALWTLLMLWIAQRTARPVRIEGRAS
jgi:undecaprenyl-diphosphatase